MSVDSFRTSGHSPGWLRRQLTFPSPVDPPPLQRSRPVYMRTGPSRPAESGRTVVKQSRSDVPTVAPGLRIGLRSVEAA